MEDISKNLGKCFKQDIGVGAYYYKYCLETMINIKC